MSLYALIGGKAVFLRDFQMTYGQEEIPTFNVTVPTRDIAGQDLYLEDISVWQDGEMIIDGIITTPFIYPELLPSISNPLFTSLDCDNNLGRLAIEAAPLYHFQNTLVSVAISTLLATAQQSSWIINDISTLEDISVTVDLRGKETLWSQLVELCKASRNVTLLRYGGFNGTNYLLDVGFFRTKHNTPKAVWSENVIEPPRFQTANQQPIKILFPVSGASPELPVDLDLALNIDATLDDVSQDYQILVGTGSIRNNLITKGAYVRRVYDSIKTENATSPSSAELNQTALALYRKAAEELEASRSSISLSVKITCEEQPIIHDAIWLESLIFEENYDLLTETFENIQSFRVAGYYRIVGITADFRERFEVWNPYTEQFISNSIYELELVAGDRRITKTATEIILEKTANTTIYDDLQTIVSGGIIRVSEVTVQEIAVSPNCNFSGPATGRNFTFSIPSAPVGSTSAIVQVKDVSPTNYDYTTTQYGNITGDDHILCVQNHSTSDWTILDDCTITISIFYI